MLPPQPLGVVILQYPSVALAPADGIVPGADQAPALFPGGHHVAVEVRADFPGVRGVPLDGSTGFQPQRQGAPTREGDISELYS